ncbi:MARCO protein, partial [Trogon melanurus]|nr:MARCO protein [Trogon melanurus]
MKIKDGFGEDGNLSDMSTFSISDKIGFASAATTTFQISEPQIQRKPSTCCARTVLIIYLLLLTVGQGLLMYKVFVMQREIFILKGRNTSYTEEILENSFADKLLSEKISLSEHMGHEEYWRRSLEEEITIIKNSNANLMMMMNNITLIAGMAPFLRAGRTMGRGGSSALLAKLCQNLCSNQQITRARFGLPASLQGQKGEMGKKGDPGPRGSTGPQGHQGVPGLPGFNGKRVGPSAAPHQHMCATGQHGPAGTPGLDGRPGQKGEKGDQGPSGSPGIPGIAGLKGEKGNKGDQGTGKYRGKGNDSLAFHPGIQGVTGQKGTKGDYGSQGPKGEPGVKGAKGEPGYPGSSGEKGSKGEKGEVGAASWVRIAGGGRRGRVEIYHEGTWGTICDDDWDTKDATVVCRMLGYNRAISAFTAIAGTGQIWLDNVNCSGNEYSIIQCSKPDWGVHNCSHGEDAGVECA